LSQSFAVVEQPEFIDMVRVLKPDIKDEDIPGRKALVAMIMREYEKEREVLKQHLKVSFHILISWE